MNSGAGKGDTPRPRQISDEQYRKNWEQAFGRTKRQPLKPSEDGSGGRKKPKAIPSSPVSQ